MSYAELAEQARGHIGPYCKACLVCDGRACSNKIPGPGAKGTGRVAHANYEAWQALHLNMNTMYPAGAIDCSLSLWGHTFELPVFVGPIGDVSRHYGDKLTMDAYNQAVLRGSAAAGSLAWTGDGAYDYLVTNACRAIAELNGLGVPTIKPWDMPTVERKFQEAAACNPFAIAMDIDSVGLAFLKGLNPPAGPKTAQELAHIAKLCPVPFVVKGIMTPAAAVAAAQAGAAGIVVSNHGGRVLDGTPATAQVLPAIAHAVHNAVGTRCKIFVDGGIRSGTDVFRALALGADACLVCRPVAVAVYAAAEKGVSSYLDQLKQELRDCMEMCGALTLADITAEMLYETSSQF